MQPSSSSRNFGRAVGFIVYALRCRNSVDRSGKLFCVIPALMVVEGKGHQNRGQGNNARGAGTAVMGCSYRVGNAIPGQARQIKCYNCNGGQDNTIDEDVDEQPIQDLALNVDNVFQADDLWNAFDSDVDDRPPTVTDYVIGKSLINRSCL
ncbi:hypothetical protein Tco_0045542 [Tanacetum coccineum]